MIEINGLNYYEDYYEFCRTSSSKGLLEEIGKTSKNLFHNTCEEFGILIPSKSFRICYYDLIPGGLTCAGIAGIDKYGYYVAYCWKLFKIEEEKMFEQTIPHELAHILFLEFYPEIGGTGGHGKHWNELNLYLGGKDLIGFPIAPHVETALGIVVSKPEILPEI